MSDILYKTKHKDNIDKPALIHPIIAILMLPLVIREYYGDQGLLQ